MVRGKDLVSIPINSHELKGILAIPERANGIVIFAHGSGSSRHSPRNNFVADFLRKSGLGTLLLDLLTPEEDEIYPIRFDIQLLCRRLAMATRWVRKQPRLQSLNIGYFGSSTGAAAALLAAAGLGPMIRAVVSRGGRPDLVQSSLSQVQAPSLLIVGALDEVVIQFNQQAFHRLEAKKAMKIIPGASHLFEESGTLEQVARLAAEWFLEHLGASLEHKTVG